MMKSGSEPESELDPEDEPSPLDELESDEEESEEELLLLCEEARVFVTSFSRRRSPPVIGLSGPLVESSSFCKSLFL